MTEANDKGSSGSGERVVLLHGLGRTRRSMRRLRIALRAAGYQPLSWGYHSRRHRIAEHVAHFRGRLEELAGAEEPVHFVGHSLGALIIRGALPEPSESAPFPLGRIVMIAPPNHGADVAERFGGTRLADGSMASRYVIWMRALPRSTGSACRPQSSASSPAHGGFTRSTRSPM